MCEQEVNFSRGIETMQESNANARNKNCDIDEVCFRVYTPDTTEERISKLQDRPTEIIQREKKKREGEKEKRKTEHLRFVPQYLEITGFEYSQR